MVEARLTLPDSKRNVAECTHGGSARTYRLEQAALLLALFFEVDANLIDPEIHILNKNFNK